MRILLVIDPLEKLNWRWDNSLRLASELSHRGHACFTADAPDFFIKQSRPFVRCRPLLTPAKNRFASGKPQSLPIVSFGLVNIRKEPPVDRAYIRFTRILERAASRIPMINHPRGIRLTNEKLSILNFPRWIPKTLVTSSLHQILKFHNTLKAPLVIKPLDQKGGKGVFLLKDLSPKSQSRLRRAMKSNHNKLMAQKFLKGRIGEKRIVLLNGDFFCCYEKRPKGKEFRANLDLGASFHKSGLTSKEKALCRALKPFLLKRGLYWVGLDVLDEKLIEINVTSPAGVTEATALWPRAGLVEALADFLEDFARDFSLRGRLA